MDQITTRTALPVGRIAIGAVTYAAPELVGKLFGFDVAGNDTAVFMARLFAIRDLALGVGTLAARADAQRLWWRLGVVCDAADAATGYLGLRAGAPKRGNVVTIAVALGAVGAGIAALRSKP